MKLKFDNLEDARNKLTNTYCLYKGRAIVVKGVDRDGDRYYMRTATVDGNIPQNIYVDDEDFNCFNYNIGYINEGHAAAWFYRIPARQYRQGLKAEQVRCICSKPEWAHEVAFRGTVKMAEMLENVYPRAEVAQIMLKEARVNVVAFHRNFAVSYDRVHDDYILEHKGKLIGHTKDFKDFKLMEDYIHLTEALREAAA